MKRLKEESIEHQKMALKASFLFVSLRIHCNEPKHTVRMTPPLPIAIFELSSAVVFSLYVNRVHHTLLPGVKTQTHTKTQARTLYNLILTCIHWLMLVFRV